MEMVVGNVYRDKDDVRIEIRKSMSVNVYAVKLKELSGTVSRTMHEYKQKIRGGGAARPTSVQNSKMIVLLQLTRSAAR